VDWKVIVFVVIVIFALSNLFIGGGQDPCESYGFRMGTPEYVGCQWEVVNDLPVTRP
jgi:hypothetical protein